MSTTQTLPTFNGENCSFDAFLIFGCKLLTEYHYGIDVCMMDGYVYSSIMPTFFTGTSALRTSAPLRKHMWVTVDTMYGCHSNFNLLWSFSIHRNLSTKDWLLPKTFVVSTFTTHRKRIWDVCFFFFFVLFRCKERMDISHTIVNSFYGEKEFLTKCSDVCSSSR